MKPTMILLALAACGSGGNGTADAPSCPDAGPACTSACVAVLSGNFAWSGESPGNCAQVGPGSGSAANDSVLAFSIASPWLDAPLAISIDLGAQPGPGTYSSETSTNWSALASRLAPGVGSDVQGECIYSAGAQAVPTGSFAMTLSWIEGTAAHGELRVQQYVQAQAQVDCGAGDNETIDVQF